MEKIKKESLTNQLPEMFRPLLWSIDWPQINLERDQKMIIVNTINYGTMAHWRWLIKHYGLSSVSQTLSIIPVTELKLRARILFGLIFSVAKFNYASRSTN